jgi:uncharacterized repeat protein (TIGR01451 family)
MKTMIFSLLSIVMLIAMALPAASPLLVVEAAGPEKITYDYKAWDRDSNSWVSNDISGYAEGECIPSYLQVTSTKTIAEDITVQLIFDYEKQSSGILAIVKYECCNCADNCTSASNPLDCCTGGTEITSCPVAGNITGPFSLGLHGQYYEWAYTWTFTIPANTTITQCWCARIGDEAALLAGASPHMEVSASGTGQISVNPGALLVPDLYATKTANVTCDEISYTINYGNSGDADQTGTTLLDVYNVTLVTVMDPDGGVVNTSAGTITWDIGNLAAGATGSKSYTVSINGGVADGTAIINSGNITGDLAETVTTNNSYNITSYARISPTATASSNSPVCEGETIELYGGPDDMTSYNWTGPGGWTSSSRNATRTDAALAMAGNYTLTVTAANGCSSSNSTMVVVNPKPTANFSANVTSGCGPLTVLFTDSSTNATSWDWSFPGGSPSGATGQGPYTVTYSSPGSYNVSLNVSNGCGWDIETKTDYITVNPQPVANFSANITNGCEPLTVLFTDSSTNATSWNWSFGDGSTSPEQNPSHQYANAGTYNVTLTVSNGCGSDTETKTDYITVDPKPTANFSANVTNGCEPLTVLFTDSSTNATSWNWSFPGGSPSSANTEGPHEVTYSSPGSYNVSLNVSNGCGWDIETKTDYITVDPQPVANFSANITSGCEPLTVLFTDSSTNATSWNWSFGDGSTSPEQNPSYQYANAGTYNVTLTVSNGCGSDTETRIGYITVVGACVATAPDFSICVGTPLDDDLFISNGANCSAGCNMTLDYSGVDNSTVGNYTYNVTCDNGVCGPTTETGTVMVVEACIATAPDFSICVGTPLDDELFISNGAGCSAGCNMTLDYSGVDNSTAGNYTYNVTCTSGVCGPDVDTGTVMVVEACVATAPDFSICEGTVVNDALFTANGASCSAGCSMTLSYSFDGNTAGNYTYNVTCDNGVCGPTTEAGTVTVNPKPAADFSANVTSGCAPLTVVFTDTSTGGPTNWEWSFPGGSPPSANTQGPHEVTYSSPGSYNVSLNVSNGCGSDTETKTGYITAEDCGPVIVSVEQIPEGPYCAGEDVTVRAHVTDDVGVTSVNLTHGRITVAMTLTSGNAQDGYWEATIPGQKAGDTLTVYVTATDGENTVSSTPHDKTWIDCNIPVIDSVEQSSDEPCAGEAVVITAHVMDDTGVTSVNLTYNLTTVAMNLTSGNAQDGYWEATIPGQPVGTTLTLYVTATDGENTVSSNPHDKTWIDCGVPVIVSVEQSSDKPCAGEDVVITAHVMDDTGVTSVNLTYNLTTVTMNLTSGTATDGNWTATIPGQPVGTTLTLYVTATDGEHTVSSTPHDKTWIDCTIPVIVSVEQSSDKPCAGEDVVITAHVTDDTGVISVNLTYNLTTVAMNLTSGTAQDGYWEATIPGQPVGTILTLYVTATDGEHTVSSTPHDKTWIDCAGPLLTITKTGNPDPIGRGGSLTYSINVTNVGNATATNVTIVDDYDETVLNITNAGGGIDNGDTITWDGGISIPVGGSISYTVTATVSLTAPLGSTFPNTANVTYAEGLSDSVTISTRIPGIPPAGGGGGGGGSPIKYLTVDNDGKITKKRLDSNDRLVQTLLGPNPEGTNSLLIEQGTQAPSVDGKRYYLIVIRELEDDEIPLLPEDTMAAVAVNITPAGALFDKDVVLTLGFNQLSGNALSATMYYYDDTNGIWIPLESEPGEPGGVAELTMSAALRHFTIFGVLVGLTPPLPPAPEPAHFAASGLNIATSGERIWEPVTFVTKTGESATITASIANDGGQEGSYTVELKINGETVDSKVVTLGVGQSEQVSFTLSGLDYGQYEVEVAGLSGAFTATRTINWWLIIIIIIAVGLISWGVVWGIRRRRAVQ